MIDVQFLIKQPLTRTTNKTGDDQQVIYQKKIVQGIYLMNFDKMYNNRFIRKTHRFRS